MQLENTLVASGLTKKMSGRNIIDNVGFTLKKGEIMGLLGPNGAGKTTTIRSLIGLVSTETGSTQIAGYDIKQDFTKAMANVGGIIETPEFYNYMTGYENLQLYARMAKTSITDERISEVLEMVKLTGAARQKVKTYSLGMRQRLGVAQAILHNPEVLLLDEPMNGLDPEGMHDFRKIMKDLANNGVSILISTHILRDIELLADHLLVLELGKVTYDGPLETLNNQTQKLLVETTDIQLAAQTLTESGIKCQIKGNLIRIDDQPDTPDFRQDIIKKLVLANVGILSYQLEHRSLEDNFIAFTQKGGNK